MHAAGVAVRSARKATLPGSFLAKLAVILATICACVLFDRSRVVPVITTPTSPLEPLRRAAPEAAAAPETAPETAPGTAPETAPGTAPETAPGTTPETPPATGPTAVADAQQAGSNGSGGKVAAAQQPVVSAARCEFPVVYNKPPKTGSSSIVIALDKWAHSVNRTTYNCRNDNTQNYTRFLGCMPQSPDSCGLLKFHVVLSPRRLRVLEQSFPHHQLLTSTRAGAPWLVSQFLQRSNVSLNSAQEFDHGGFLDFLKRYEVWEFYGYHTGKRVNSSTSVYGDEGQELLNKLAERYDVVIDIALRGASNAVLASKRLFQLGSVAANVRGSAMVTFDDETDKLLTQKTAMLEALHRKLVRRLAWLYFQATGRRECYDAATHEERYSCLGAVDEEHTGGD